MFWMWVLWILWSVFLIAKYDTVWNSFRLPVPIAEVYIALCIAPCTVSAVGVGG